MYLLYCSVAWAGPFVDLPKWYVVKAICLQLGARLEKWRIKKKTSHGLVANAYASASCAIV